MSALPRPIRDALSLPRDASAEERMWRHIEARSTRATIAAGDEASPGRSRGVWPRRAAFALVPLAAALAAVLAIAGISSWRRASPVAASSPVPRSVAAATALAPAPGPLVLAGGARMGARFADARAEVITASDGSRVALDPGAAVEPLENTGSVLVLRQPRGRVAYDVTPGGPRNWRIDCGLATVEVVGTSFTVARDAHDLHVTVAHGVVLVRGERVPGGVQRLGAGETLDVHDAADPPGAAPVASRSAETATPSREHAAPVARVPPVAWRALARAGDHRAAYDDLGRAGLVRAAADTTSAHDLLVLADIARLSGHPAEAVAPLQRVVLEHPNDPEAPLAAFTLGKVQLEALGAAAPAAESFRTAMRLGLHGGLREDVYVWLVEAEVRAGDRAAAARTADTYAREFPAGTRGAAIRRWLAREAP